MEAQIEALRAEFEADAAEVKKTVALDNKREEQQVEQSDGDGKEPQSQRLTCLKRQSGNNER